MRPCEHDRLELCIIFIIFFFFAIECAGSHLLDAQRLKRQTEMHLVAGTSIDMPLFCQPANRESYIIKWKIYWRAAMHEQCRSHRLS